MSPLYQTDLRCLKYVGLAALVLHLGPLLSADQLAFKAGGMIGV